MKSLFVVLATFTSLKLFAGLGNPNAPIGGDFLYNLGSPPTSLNPLSSVDGGSSRVQSYVFESLLDRNLDSYEWEPSLAESWRILNNGMTFEFKLRPGMKWSDGKEITVEDVKFSFDAIVDKNNTYKTASQKPYYEKIKEAKIIDKNTIEFIAQDTYFNNFEVVATMVVVPKHVYEKKSDAQMKKLNKTMVGSGPYMLDSFDRSKKLVLKRNPLWWGNNEKSQKGHHNFARIIMKFIKDEMISLTTLERGELDIDTLSPEIYMKKTNGPKWGKDIFKVKAENKAPGGYSFIGWNLNDPLFKSKKTRKALAHLLNRELMIEKFEYNFAVPATGPLYIQSEYADKNVKPVNFDPKEAIKLLKEDGWKDTDGDQILDKMIDGKKVKFSFTILEPLADFLKYLTIYKEDAKKIGVEVNIKQIEWNSFIKLVIDERKFQAVRLAWGGGSVEWEPKQVWHTSSIANGGSNFVGYSNKEVDKLIDEAQTTMDKKTRVKLLKKVYSMIAEDYPYAFFFNNKYIFYGHTKKMKKVRDTYNYGVGVGYWWVDK